MEGQAGRALGRPREVAPQAQPEAPLQLLHPVDSEDAGLQPDPPRRRGLAGCVDGVVEQVADDRHEVARVGHAGRHLQVVVHPQLDAALARLRGLAEHQRRQLGLRDLAHHDVGEVLGDGQLGRGEPQRVLGAAELDQRDDRLQLVRRLVGLRGERLGEPADRLQLADQGA